MRIVNSKKVNIPIRIASVMLCLVLFSLYMTSGMLAKYTTGGKTDMTGRVAKLTVGAKDAGINEFVFQQEASIQPDGDYTVIVENESEVAVRYTIELRFDKAVPEYLTVNRVGENNALTPLDVDENDPKIVKLDVDDGDLIPIDGTATELIRFAVDYNKFVDGQLSAEEQTFNFTTIVTFVQID